MKRLAVVALVACGGSRSPQSDGTGGPAIALTVTVWGARPEMIEQQVLMPLEQKLAGEPNVATVHSVASPNQGRIVIWLKRGTDPFDAARHANESVKDMRSVLPPEAGSPMITIGDPDARPDIASVVTSKTMSIGDVSDLLERTVVPALSTKVGVRRVRVTGARPRELQFQIDAERVRAMGITHDEVIHAIANTDHFTVEEAGNIQIAQLSRVPVLVKDIASVNVTSAPPITDEPLGIAIWLQKPEQRAEVEQAFHEVLLDVPRTVEFASAPPRLPAPTLAIELVGEDRVALDVVGDSLISDLADIATLKRELPAPKEPQRVLEIDPAAQTKLNVKAESVRAIVSAYARAPLSPSGTSLAISFDLGSSPLDAILVRATDGAAIPLSMFAKVEMRPATPLARVNLRRAMVLTVELKPGGSASDVQTLLDKHPRISHHLKDQAPRARLVTRQQTR